MGKFERGEAEKLELGLVDLLNGKQSARHNKCLDKVKEMIIKTNPGVEIQQAVFIGRKYDEPGDIKLIKADGKVIYIELKLVEGGKGTRANISQNALTDLGLVYDPRGRTLSWSSFREENNFDKQVLNELNRFQKYPADIKSKEEKAKYLIDNYIHPPHGGSVEKKAAEILQISRVPEERIAAEILLNVARIARNDKLKYIQYLRGLKQDNEKIKRFTILLLLGFHKMDILKRGLMNFERMISLLRSGDYKMKTYYVIKNSCNVFVEDLSCWVPLFLNTHFDLEFSDDETSVFIRYFDDTNKTYRRILRIVFHWKNIFQGVKTPCLNIFDEGILKDYLTCSQS